MCSLVYSMRGVVLVSVYSVYVGVVHVPGLSTSSFLWPLLTGTDLPKAGRPLFQAVCGIVPFSARASEF